MIFSVVLYDAVAGGAGHVRRIVTADGQAFQRVLAKAISVVDNCDCDSSCYRCLRNYYNQKIHDNLNRNQASAFFTPVGWKHEPITGGNNWIKYFPPAIAGENILVCPMRFERTTFRVGVWHSIQLSYGHIFSLSIISGIYGFCKGKQEKQKNIQNLRKKLLTFCEQGDKIKKLSPTGRQRRCTLKIEQHSLEIDRKVNGESL